MPRVAVSLQLRGVQNSGLGLLLPLSFPVFFPPWSSGCFYSSDLTSSLHHSLYRGQEEAWTPGQAWIQGLRVHAC